MGRRGIIDEATRTVFFWSAKSACQTLFQTLADHYGKPKTAFNTGSQPWPLCVERIQKDGFRSVVLVRHPAIRLVSAYLNKFLDFQGKELRDRSQLEPFAQELFDRHRALHGGNSSRNDLSFEAFLDTVVHMHRVRRNPSGPDVNYHWDTQVPPRLLEMGVVYDHVLRVETLDRDLERLCANLGISYMPKRLNASQLGDAGHGYLGDRVPAELFGRPYAHRDFLSKESLALIREIHDVDYRTFGYAEDPFGA